MAQRRIAFYGDDFTGSTDVMESLAMNGVETALFLSIPDAGILADFAHCAAIGLAGTSRSQSPGWMDDNLPSAFTFLRSQNADFCHYKICSTFDSSPQTGNIGHAIEIGKRVFSQACVPLIVGAPQLKRYTAFGQLFAGYQGNTYRIDRHPVMSRHPVTPMREADLRVHLGEQTSLAITLADLALLDREDADDAVDALLAHNPGIVMFDVADKRSQRCAGGQLARLRNGASMFVAGSSGVEYALIEHWRQTGTLPQRPEFGAPAPVNQLIVISGSCSPTTEGQIRHALSNGFGGVALDAVSLAKPDAAEAIERAIQSARIVMNQGSSPLLYTALGPQSDQSGPLGEVAGARHCLGQNLGKIARALVGSSASSRLVIAGGDTSSHALGELAIKALTLLMPLPQSPGSPLCLAHGNQDSTIRLEIALKGGQVGKPSYFTDMRDGTFG